MEWQPIETAPKDGSEILACDMDGLCSVVRFDKHENAFVGVSMGTEFWDCYFDTSRPIEIITHWQPLPEPPKSE